MKKLSLLLAVLCCLLLPLQSLAAIPEAPADGQSIYVLDAANVIDSADENAMLALGAALDDASTAQVVAVTVEFLDGMSAEEYAYQLFNSWGIGSAKEENGVLLLLSVGEREYWVTLGKGIEKKLTVSKATEIVDDTALDSFAAGDYSSGMRAAYEGLCERVAEIYSVSLDTAALGAQSALNEKPATGSLVSEPQQAPVAASPAKGGGFVGLIVTIITPGAEVFGGDTHPELARVYLKNSLRLHHGVFSAISASESLDLPPVNLRLPSLNWRKVRSCCRLFFFQIHPKDYFCCPYFSSISFVWAQNSSSARA